MFYLFICFICLQHCHHQHILARGARDVTVLAARKRRLKRISHAIGGDARLGRVDDVELDVVNRAAILAVPGYLVLAAAKDIERARLCRLRICLRRRRERRDGLYGLVLGRGVYHRDDTDHRPVAGRLDRVLVRVRRERAAQAVLGPVVKVHVVLHRVSRVARCLALGLVPVDVVALRAVRRPEGLDVYGEVLPDPLAQGQIRNCPALEDLGIPRSIIYGVLVRGPLAPHLSRRYGDPLSRDCALQLRVRLIFKHNISPQPVVEGEHSAAQDFLVCRGDKGTHWKEERKEGRKGKVRRGFVSLCSRFTQSGLKANVCSIFFRIC